MREGPTTAVVSASTGPAIRHALGLFVALVLAYVLAMILSLQCLGGLAQVSALGIASPAITTATPLAILFGSIVHARRITKRGPVVPLCFLAGAVHVTSQAIVTWTWNHELGVPSWLGPPPVTPIDVVFSRIVSSLASSATLVNAFLFGLGFFFAAYGPRPLGAALLLGPWAAHGLWEWSATWADVPAHPASPWAPYRAAVYTSTVFLVAALVFPLADRLISGDRSKRG